MHCAMHQKRAKYSKNKASPIKRQVVCLKLRQAGERLTPSLILTWKPGKINGNKSKTDTPVCCGKCLKRKAEMVLMVCCNHINSCTHAAYPPLVSVSNMRSTWLKRFLFQLKLVIFKNRTSTPSFTYGLVHYHRH